MKKILFLLLFTVSIYGQTLQNPTYGTVKLKTNTATAETSKIVSQQPTTGELNYVNATALPISIAVQDSLDLKANTGLPYNTNLYTDKIIIYGNSIETGAGAEPRSVYGWQAIAPQILETKVDNYAISGTTLVKFFDGDNSGIDRLSIITPAYVSTMRAYISGIGVNDMYNVNGTYNETNFRTAYNTLIDQLVTDGYPLSKIYLFFPLTANSNTSIMNSTVANIASLKGVNFIDVKGAMDANGGLALISGDGIHPNNEGHKIIAETIANAVTGTKYNFTQFNQDISTTGVVNAGVGISGGSGSNGLEIRGTNEVNSSGKISLFGDVYFNKNIINLNSGSKTTPKYIKMGAEYANAALNGSNLQFYTYYSTGLGTTAEDGLGLYSMAGTTNRITSYQEHFFKNGATLNNAAGAITTPVKFNAGAASYTSGAVTTSNTFFAGYGGSGIGFSGSEGISIVSGNGLVPLITLKNPVNISGNLAVTGNATFGSVLFGAQTTPSFLDLGSSFSNSTVTGSSLKIKLYPNTGIGVDGSNGLVLLSTAGTGNRITSLSNHAFSNNLYITNTPTTSASTYDFLSRNTSTGVVEKITSASIAPIASPAFTGTPTAPTATAGTNTTQIATTAFVQAAKKYKTYIGILNQSSTSAPTVTVIDNELSSAIVWTYSSVGGYVGTLIGAFTNNKTSINFTNGQAGNGIYGAYRISDNAINITSSNSTTGIASDGLIWNATIEVRVYN